jgi:thiol-disulfide isomerase/thioredoxin
MVAMFGWIIPLPFPMPPIVMTLLSGKVISSAICFRAKSVVQMAVAAAEAAGRPILVHVYADWCPTCRAQEPVISRLSAADRFHQLVIFRLDYDHQAAQWRALGVRMQSTLIAFHGAKETARMVGGTDEASIEPVLDATLR